MKILHLLILLFWAGYTQAADEYRVSGTVTKKGGGPLKGVTVLLKGKNVSATTTTDGKFEIAPPVAIQMKTPQTQTLSFRLQGNTVRFSPADGMLRGNVSIFSGNGRRITSIDFSDLNPVSSQITLPQLASGLNIVRVTINNSVYTCQVIRMGNELHLTNQKSVSRPDDAFSLSKKAASEAIDTLIATKEGFKESKTPIDTLILSNVSIEMDSIVSSGDVAWGREENPTAHCNVTGTLPGYSQLQPNSKLPDPFMMLDGSTRITKKSEWACRRQELYKQVLHYIYGEKPIPAKGSVTGTVSTSKITVKVSENGKSCSFEVSVDMNGAQQPAPAIIYYDGGFGSPTPIPSGVAKIRFNAIEAQGGSGAKSGPFYTFYGSNHPAGYMTAQAWQISRIIDVLEQKPDIIDPYRIGLTGCSRNGKGAFAGGVLDNRIALTIPVESGIGGAVGLRLVEQLGGGEWPYHAISYVRWLSEVALKDFAKGNNASGDNTDRLPVDMHSAMALIAPRAIYVVDNPGINNLDPKEAWVTANAGKDIFKALGVGNNFAYVGAGGNHCLWRPQYTSELDAMIDKFLKGNNSANTGSMTGGASVDVKKYIDWTAPELAGEL